MNAKFFSGTAFHLAVEFNEYIDRVGIAPGLILDLQIRQADLSGEGPQLEVLLVHGDPEAAAKGRPKLEIIQGTAEKFPAAFRDFGRTLNERKRIWHKAYCVGEDHEGRDVHSYAALTYRD